VAEEPAFAWGAIPCKLERDKPGLFGPFGLRSNRRVQALDQSGSALVEFLKLYSRNFFTLLRPFFNVNNQSLTSEENGG
jgi:hypothetical protein